jgi:hypothetical protein
MVESIAQIIGKINPQLYATNGGELLKKYGSPDKIPAQEIKPKSLVFTTPSYGGAKLSKEGTEASFTLGYDSTSETLEPIYFFIMDLVSNNFGFSLEKLVDNFTSSPGSGHFSELGQRATVMQQQASKMLGDVNTVLRSVLNIIYDLKDFRIRLEHYNNINSKEPIVKESALLGLKQVWLDKVDIQKGQGAIHAMTTGNLQFTTLRDAFLASKDEKTAKELDLNERVKRILLSRIQEFNIWLKESESELRKRYELERTYLKSQVNSLNLYSRWVRPYLKAAADLEQKEQGRNVDLVKTFNTILLELTILGKKEIDIEGSALSYNLPREFRNFKPKRKYYSCILIDLSFRGIPQRISQQSHYVFGGKTTVTFKAYALNEDELKKLNQELEKSDLSSVLKLIEGTTGESIGQLQEEIDFFLKDKGNEETKEEKSSSQSSNPFLALIGYYNKEKPEGKKEESKDKSIKVRADDWIESTHLRTLAAAEAIDKTFTIFDIYKKAHGMASYT